jgi:hypothetical protein
MKRVRRALAAASAAIVLCAPASAQSPAPADVQVERAPDALVFRTARPYATALLRVVGASARVIERRYAAGAPIALALPELPDGAYVYELTLDAGAPLLRRDGTPADAARHGAGTGLAASGAFRMVDGVAYVAAAQAPGATDEDRAGTAKARRGAVLKDQLFADDLVVQGSACIGLDCVNNESFGFDTLRLKENNTRIKFEDTSSSAGFPTHDWQLTANDSASGGADKFAIEDVTAVTVPFTLMGSAPSNSLFVSSTGKVGLRTATPLLDLHVYTGDTPGIRLEQSSAGGFTPQTWDVAGNEANFFVRDVTGGSRLPLRIRPGAPTSSVDIAASGNVGIGTAGPAAPLHVYRNGGTAELRVEEASATIAPRTLVSLHNQGDVAVRYTNVVDAQSGGGWFLTSRAPGGAPANAFTIGRYSYAAGALPSQPPAGSQLTLDAVGNLVIAGTLTQGSSRTIKQNIERVDPAQLLDRLRALPVYRWNYIGGDAADRHLGPLAEDFHRAFGLGVSERTLAPADVASVALGAAQALARTLAERDGEIAALRARLDALERRLGAPAAP